MRNLVWKNVGEGDIFVVGENMDLNKLVEEYGCVVVQVPYEKRAEFLRLANKSGFVWPFDDELRSCIVHEDDYCSGYVLVEPGMISNVAEVGDVVANLTKNTPLFKFDK